MSKQILIVDDEDDGVLYLEELVRSLGFQPIRAYRWNQALELLEANEYCAMFLDLDLGISPNDGFILMDQMVAKNLYVPTQIVSYAADLLGETAQSCFRYVFARRMPIPKDRLVNFRDLLAGFLEEAQGLVAEAGAPRTRQSSRQVGIWEEGGNAPEKRRRVFVAYGRNENIRTSMFNFLTSIGLIPIEWIKAVQMTGKGTPYIGEILDAAFENAQATVVIFTPDDDGILREEFRSPSDPEYESSLTGQPRLNVVLEAGIGLGRHQDRIIIVEMGRLRPISDLLGRHTVKMDNSIGKRESLALRLDTAGCVVDLAGTDWHHAGDFSIG